jgi:hypothetical protein
VITTIGTLALALEEEEDAGEDGNAAGAEELIL